MSDHEPSNEARELLCRLAISDECSLRTVLAPAPRTGSVLVWPGPALDRMTRALVRLAALLVVDASSDSLSWAVDLASTSGADAEAVVAVLLAIASAAGSAQLVAAAPRLALALGVETAVGEVASY